VDLIEQGGGVSVTSSDRFLPGELASSRTAHWRKPGWILMLIMSAALVATGCSASTADRSAQNDVVDETTLAQSPEDQPGKPPVVQTSSNPPDGTIMPKFGERSKLLASNGAFSVSIDSAPQSVDPGQDFSISGHATGFDSGVWINAWVRLPDGTQLDDGGLISADGTFTIPMTLIYPGETKIQVSAGKWPEEQWSQAASIAVSKGADTAVGVAYHNLAGGVVIVGSDHQGPRQPNATLSFEMKRDDPSGAADPTATMIEPDLAVVVATVSDANGGLNSLAPNSRDFTIAIRDHSEPAPVAPQLYLTGTEGGGASMYVAWRPPAKAGTKHEILSRDDVPLETIPAGQNSATVSVPNGAVNPSDTHVKIKAVAADGQSSPTVDVWGGPTTIETTKATGIGAGSRSPGTVWVSYNAFADTTHVGRVRVDVCNENGDCRVEWLIPNNPTGYTFRDYEAGNYTVGVRSVWNNPWQFSDIEVFNVTVN
jgi:hypothetical protein